MAAKKPTHDEVLESWTERDLTESARRGELPRAYEVDDQLDQLSELIGAERNPVLLGESGVGKSALMFEWVRRQVGGEMPDILAGRRVLQISLEVVAGRSPNASKYSERFGQLCDALLACGDTVLPYVRDAHLIEHYDLETATAGVLARARRGMVWEGLQGRFEAMYEYAPQLEQYFVPLRIDEPALDRAQGILDAWSSHEYPQRFEEEALEQALELTHRFLVRGKLPRKALDLLRQLDATTDTGRTVRGADVVERFCVNHRTPRVILDPAIPLDLGELERDFNKTILGQSEAVHAIVRTIGMIKAGLSDTRRPLGAFLFVGPTGVGKTHLAQRMAAYLFGSPERMVRFNMADYSEEWNVHKLFGDPNAGSLGRIRGDLTMRLLGHPFCVLLLDELEKAHNLVHDRLLQLIDDGSFTNAAGETIACRSTIIVATSNAGAEIFRGETFGFGDMASRDRKRAELERRLEEHFRVEFLNRFDQVVQFHPLTREDIRAVALRELQQLGQRIGLRRRRLQLEFDPSVIDWLVVNGYDPDYGARFLRRAMERHVTTELASAIVRRNPPAGARLELFVRGDAIRSRVVPPEARELRVSVRLPHRSDEVVRDLTHEQLVAEARRALEQSTGYLKQLEADRQARSEELARMQADGFWDRDTQRQETLERFRKLDVAIRLRERLARPLLRLEELLEEGNEPPSSKRLADLLEQANRSLREWQAQANESSAARVWLVLSAADPLQPPTDWLGNLVEMELRWCNRLRLTARPVAFSEDERRLTRVVLEVEGPGAARYLAMEVGVHREVRAQRADKRVLVELFTPGLNEESEARASAVARPVEQLGLRGSHRTTVNLEQRGLQVELLGEDPDALSQITETLERAWSADAEDRENARIYGGDAGARDPRTGAQVPRLKDALRGKLERLLDAWHEHVAQSDDEP